MPIFTHLEWHDDRMTCNGWVYRLEHETSHTSTGGGEEFRFYKDRGLINAYDDFFASRPSFRPQRIMEIGVWDGGSVALWHDVFRPQKHVAIDLQRRADSGYFRRFVAALDAGERLKTYWGVDQADAARLETILESEFDGPLDLVIDDASHLYEPTLASFQTLFPRLAPGGLYIIEDSAWEHWSEYDAVGNDFEGLASPSRLIHELVECVGTRGSPIAGVTVAHGFAVIERSSVPLAADEPFRLAEHTSRRLICGVRPESAAAAPQEGELTAFVVSWRGQHDRAVAIADAIGRTDCGVQIVFSDPDLSLILDCSCPTVRRPDHLFWGDKFTACLERCRSGAMLLIQADCDCNDWGGLVTRCRQVLAAVPQCGLWAAHINGTPYGSDVAAFARLSSNGLSAAAQTDAIVLGIARPVLERLRRARLNANIYGWGIDQLATAAAYSGGQVAVIDPTVRVVHPSTRGYPTDLALSQWRDFLSQFTPVERDWHELLWAFLAAGVALKARRTGKDVDLGGHMVAASGPATTASLESDLAVAQATLLQRCETRLADAQRAASRLMPG